MQAVLHIFCAVDLIAACSFYWHSRVITAAVVTHLPRHARFSSDLRGSAELFYIDVMDQTRSTAVQHNRALHNEKGAALLPACISILQL